MRNRRFFGQHATVDDENPYWISFSDIMSGLLVIFVLASLALILELTITKFEVNDAIREIARAEQVRRDILQEVEEDLRKRNINVEISDNHTVLRIPENVLYFDNNEYRIPEFSGIKETVLEIGRVLYVSITKEARWKYLDTIFIEGHTDRRPSPRHMGNWGLSTFRAISVWDYWNANLPESMRLNELKNHSGSPLFSVSGYGETRPVQEIQETENDFQKNRRIDIRFTVRRPVLEEFTNIKKLLEE
ncbi:MAG TPA: chemotaxis protein MotB [Thermodesulforhabdus norvegica]|uniref:Chemotaxis protein MotB n=1 Tax=Thermodesulforhabdus norvegica TaxID=39841 RepID=A0A7C1AYC1_9BACT|nr:chemotaxis protein MotB [Thermodesulforhabdus norvegica]